MYACNVASGWQNGVCWATPSAFKSTVDTLCEVIRLTPDIWKHPPTYAGLSLYITERGSTSPSGVEMTVIHALARDSH